MFHLPVLLSAMTTTCIQPSLTIAILATSYEAKTCWNVSTPANGTTKHQTANVSWNRWNGTANFTISHILVVDCKPLTAVPFGTIKYATNTTYLGSEVMYACANTHRLNGIAKRTCLESGQWSDSSPKCEEIRCPEPVLAMHSILSVTGNDRMYGRTLIRSHQDSSSSIQTYKVSALAKYR